jgi:hypothetical protein
MTADDRFTADLERFLDDRAGTGRAAYLADALARTAGAAQLPSWRGRVRWPVVPGSHRLAPAPRLGLLVIVTLVLVALIGVALLAAASRLSRPAPVVGLARNGPVLHELDGDIYRFDPATGTDTPVVTGPERDAEPSYSRDGQRFMFLRGGPDDTTAAFMVADADGSDVHRVSAPLDGWTSADWSPDGSRLAISAVVDGIPSITIANADGSGSRVLDLLGMPAESGSWLGTSGDELVFSGGPTGGGYGLYLVPADGSARARPVPGAPEAGPGAYTDVVSSLDGGRIAFSSLVEASWPAGGATWTGLLDTVRVLDRATGTAVAIPLVPDPMVPTRPMDQLAPVLSPDGSHVAFRRGRSDGSLELIVAPVDGSTPGTRVGPFIPTETPGVVKYAFSPDGRTILLIFGNQAVAHLLPIDGGPDTIVPIDAGPAGGRGVALPAMQRLAP